MSESVQLTITQVFGRNAGATEQQASAHTTSRCKSVRFRHALRRRSAARFSHIRRVDLDHTACYTVRHIEICHSAERMTAVAGNRTKEAETVSAAMLRNGRHPDPVAVARPKSARHEAPIEIDDLSHCRNAMVLTSGPPHGSPFAHTGSNRSPITKRTKRLGQSMDSLDATPVLPLSCSCLSPTCVRHRPAMRTNRSPSQRQLVSESARHTWPSL